MTTSLLTLLQAVLLLTVATAMIAASDEGASQQPPQQQQQQHQPHLPHQEQPPTQQQQIPPVDEAAAAAAAAADAEKHHEAFLGTDQAPDFNQLSPEEAQQKLVSLLKKLDTNNDGSTSMAEMENWLRKVAHRERVRMSEARFKQLKATSNSESLLAPLTLAEYERATQTELDEDAANAAAANVTQRPGVNHTVESSHTAMMERNRRRWKAADANSDGGLTAAELADFLWPEDVPGMRGVVLQESLANTDSNGDGRVDMGEYLRDLYPDYDRDRREGKKMPEWVAKEEAHFRERLDLDKNGYLDRDEVLKYTLPDTADHAKAEMQYLFEEADENKDNFLSPEEVMRHWNIFVGHRATSFGAFDHDEL